jgi:hypothetical protein
VRRVCVHKLTAQCNPLTAVAQMPYGKCSLTREGMQTKTVHCGQGPVRKGRLPLRTNRPLQSFLPAPAAILFTQTIQTAFDSRKPLSYPVTLSCPSGPMAIVPQGRFLLCIASCWRQCCPWAARPRPGAAMVVTAVGAVMAAPAATGAGAAAVAPVAGAAMVAGAAAAARAAMVLQQPAGGVALVVPEATTGAPVPEAASAAQAAPAVTAAWR